MCFLVWFAVWHHDKEHRHKGFLSGNTVTYIPHHCTLCHSQRYSPVYTVEFVKQTTIYLSHPRYIRRSIYLHRRHEATLHHHGNVPSRHRSRAPGHNHSRTPCDNRRPHITTHRNKRPKPTHRMPPPEAIQPRGRPAALRAHRHRRADPGRGAGESRLGPDDVLRVPHAGRPGALRLAHSRHEEGVCGSAAERRRVGCCGCCWACVLGGAMTREWTFCIRLWDLIWEASWSRGVNGGIEVDTQLAGRHLMKT